MANKNLFKSLMSRLAPKADTVNEAGGLAYARSSKHALAQYAMTGCLNGTFYASAEMQLSKVLELAEDCDDLFLAALAVHAREKGYMKDLPALLVAILSSRDPVLFQLTFDRVIDNGKMLRNFVQIMRSGVTGRKSLGSGPKRAVLRFLSKRSDAQVFADSVGNDPSMADVIKMVHPVPETASRRSLYGYMIGRPHDLEALPQLVKDFEAFKRSVKDGKAGKAPAVPFRMLTGLDIPDRVWKDIARDAKWHATRMNLNSFARHGVFEDRELVKAIAKRLADPKLVERAKAFPYQLLAAYSNAGEQVPREVKNALHDAMEVAVENVPKLEGRVWVLPDISGSMHSPVTGYRQGSTSKVRCIDVAALVTAAILRRNPEAEVLPFHDRVVPKHGLVARDSVLTNAQRLARLPSGGTDCSAPLEWLNAQRQDVDLVVFVSDNQSWIDENRTWNGGSAVMRQWERLKNRNRAAKMVCIDVQPYGTQQAPDRKDILNVGGFSDAVFELLGHFDRGEVASGHWVAVIESMAETLKTA